MDFDPFLIFDAIIGTKVDHFRYVIQEQPNASQVDRNSFGMHILHGIRSLSRTLLDQNSYTSGTICYR